MHKGLALLVVFCGAASADAGESGEFQNWCAKDGTVINQVEDGVTPKT
jgi:hypothetical protein